MADGQTEGAKSPSDHRDAPIESMADNVMRPLEVAFDAAVARDEELAADDLAVSFDQDRRLGEVLARLPSLSVIRAEGHSLPVTQVGTDYVTTTGPQSQLIPNDQVAYRVGGGSEAIGRPEANLLEVLRHLARSQALVDVETREGTFRGRLCRARRDHLQLETATGTLLIPLAIVGGVSIRRGG